jgi:hypothetical protein
MTLTAAVMSTFSAEGWDTMVSDDAVPDPKPKEYLEFNTPPLALVIAMQEAGKDGSEIYQTLIGVGKRPHIKADSVISSEHQAHAAKIYSYFAKKHVLRRIKGEYISEYMVAVEDLCENRKKIDVNHLKALISLPRIFKQNREIEKIMKGHTSAPKLDAFHFPLYEGVVEFVDSVIVKDRTKNEKHYFFRTPENYLMRIVVKKHEYGANAWDCLAKFGKLKIKTDASFTMTIKGYDFAVVQPSPAHMEINPL